MDETIYTANPNKASLEKALDMAADDGYDIISITSGKMIEEITYTVPVWWCPWQRKEVTDRRLLDGYLLLGRPANTEVQSEDGNIPCGVVQDGPIS